jgi:hypothetical protein
MFGYNILLSAYILQALRSSVKRKDPEINAKITLHYGLVTSSTKAGYKIRGLVHCTTLDRDVSAGVNIRAFRDQLQRKSNYKCLK